MLDFNTSHNFAFNIASSTAGLSIVRFSYQFEFKANFIHCISFISNAFYITEFCKNHNIIKLSLYVK